jgi:O-antigen ligase
VAVSLATRPVSQPLQKPHTEGLARPIWAREATVLAVALPFLFLHVEFQPGVSIGFGSTTVGVELSDLAVLAVVVAAAVAGLRHGFGVLRAALPLWLAAGALVAWIFVATFYGPLVLDGYPVLENLVTAAKFAEYALLALAVPLLVRSRDDLRPALALLVAWSVLATVVGVLQFLGADIFDAWPAGFRQPSFLSHNDFAALSGAAYLLGLWSRNWVAVASGALGLVLSAAVAGLVGIALAVGALALLVRRERGRVALALGLSGVVAAGVLALRSGDVGDFLRFTQDEEPRRTSDVETYSQRTLLAYIGWRIFLDHPLTGVGWQGSTEPEAFEPQLSAARERFPDAAPLAFPSPERRHGVQNAYVQALADLGVVGFVLLAALFTVGLAIAARAAIRGSPLGLLWLLLTVGLWGAQGLVTGIPLAALTWIALGLAAARG